MPLVRIIIHELVATVKSAVKAGCNKHPYNSLWAWKIVL